MDTEIRTNIDDTTSTNSKPESENDEETFLSLVPRRSPTPEKCAVCLNNKQNDIIARIDSCSHTFCFDCILQWSKVRSICPLCKQPFSVITRERYSGDIIEEIRIASTETRSSVPRYSSLNELLFWFDQDRNHVDMNSTHHPMAVFRQMVYFEWLNSNVSLVRRPNYRRGSSLSRFRNSTSTSTTFANVASRDSILRLLRRYLEESTTELPNEAIYSQSSRQTVAFRRFIYLNRLFVRSPVVGSDQVTITTRDCSPQWFASNPACLHRLVPFLTRDLLALLSNEERLIERIIEEILGTISIHEIQSRPMIRRLNGYLGRYTKHFLHELYAFARCPYDLSGFDRHAQYSRSTRTATRTLPIAISLDDDEQDESTPIILDDTTTQIDLTLPSESTNAPESRSSSPECEIVEYLQPTRPRTPTLIVLSEDEEQQNEVTISSKRKHPQHHKDRGSKSKNFQAHTTAVFNDSASSIVLDDEESMETSEQVNIED